MRFVPAFGSLIPSSLPRRSGKDSLLFDRLLRKAGRWCLRFRLGTRIHRLNCGGGDTIVAECDVLSRLVSPANKDVLGFEIAMESAGLIDPFWQGASGSIEGAILRVQLPPDAVPIRLLIPWEIRGRYHSL